MQTIQRTLAKAIEETNDSFKVLLLTGPRQVGKTTLLQERKSKTAPTIRRFYLR